MFLERGVGAKINYLDFRKTGGGKIFRNIKLSSIANSLLFLYYMS